MSSVIMLVSKVTHVGCFARSKTALVKKAPVGGRREMKKLK